jgi:CDP-6-deoxy-D-xylo-4-hexulose-3-dehydrase
VINYPLASSTWNHEEVEAAKEIIESGLVTMGAEVKAFEDEFARYFGSRYAVMFNSGSSANLGLLNSLKYLYPDKIKSGSEVIVPAVSWSTTFFPVCQSNNVLRFVDIDINTLNLDIELLERSISPNTRAIFAVNLLGNPAELEKMRVLADSYGLLLLEDNCESMGAKLNERATGTFGIGGTFSFYFSHHISTMEGGMVLTDSEELSHFLISTRAHGWTRGLPKANHVHPLSDNPWDDLFRFVIPGYNLRPLEVSAAIGRVQLRKFNKFLVARRNNAEFFTKALSGSQNYLIQAENGTSSWFGFSLILRNSLEGKRTAVINELAKLGVETRPIVAGNFLRNPVLKHLDFIAEGEFNNAENVHENGFFIGNHHYPTEEKLSQVIDALLEIEKRLKN